MIKFKLSSEKEVSVLGEHGEEVGKITLDDLAIGAGARGYKAGILLHGIKAYEFREEECKKFGGRHIYVKFEKENG